MIKKALLLFASAVLVFTSVFTSSARAEELSKQIVDNNPISVPEITDTQSRREEVWKSALENQNKKKTASNNRIAQTGDGPFGVLGLYKSNLKPLFQDKMNTANADRINLVFVFTDTYTNAVSDNIVQLQNFVQADSNPVIPVPSSGAAANFGYGYGLFSVEPYKSNKDKFNLWYYDGKFDADSPDIIGDDFQLEQDNLGLDYLTPIILTANQNVRNNAVIANHSEKEGVVTNFYPGYGRQISMPQAGTPISNYSTLVHESGHFLFALGDEYTESGYDQPSYYYPNCVRFNAAAQLHWGQYIGQVDPFYNQVVTQLQNAGYAANQIPARANIETRYIREGCRYDSESYQVKPSVQSMMNQHFKMPVFGSVNRALIERTLALFSGTSTFQSKPSVGNPIYDFNSGKVNYFALFTPQCYRNLMIGKEYLQCNFELNGSYDNKNKDNIIFLSFNELPSAGNGFNRFKPLSKPMPCYINNKTLVCDRIDVTTLTQRSGFLQLIMNNWYISINTSVMSQLNQVPASFFNVFDFRDVDTQYYDKTRNNNAVFISSDFDKNGVDDVVWRHEPTGSTHIWRLDASGKKIGTYVLPIRKESDGHFLAAYGDFDGDGDGDMIWRNRFNGETVLWLLENGAIAQTKQLDTHPLSNGWYITAAGKFNQDNTDDLVWRNSLSGSVSIWMFDQNGNRTPEFNDTVRLDTDWILVGVCSMNGEKTNQMMWRNLTTGDIHTWVIDNGWHTGSVFHGVIPVNSGWEITGCADFSGDGLSDILWRNMQTGETHIWVMELFNVKRTIIFDNVKPNTGWKIAKIGQFNGKDAQDILWRNSNTGETHTWNIKNGIKESTAVNDIVKFNSGWQVSDIDYVLKK